MPKHFSEEEKTEIRARLISVGLELFEKYGISKANVNDITARAGISKGSFYAFFASKGDLFMEVYRLERERAHEEILAELATDERDLGELMVEYSKAVMRKLKERPILEIVYDPPALAMISDQSVRDRLLLFNDQINKKITDMIQNWMDRDGAYTVDAKIVTKMFRSINFLKFHKQAIGVNDFDMVVSTMTEAVVDYIKHAKIR
ncbi:MAG: TetR/AcrR family transcriptional regulator [Oscillospiraceae bacterium]|nr:TetR/AcrR family transcriptional regulator [Oscillospiraceae bacterium]